MKYSALLMLWNINKVGVQNQSKFENFRFFSKFTTCASNEVYLILFKMQHVQSMHVLIDILQYVNN